MHDLTHREHYQTLSRTGRGCIAASLILVEGDAATLDANLRSKCRHYQLCSSGGLVASCSAYTLRTTWRLAKSQFVSAQGPRDPAAQRQDAAVLRARRPRDLAEVTHRLVERGSQAPHAGSYF